MGSLDWHELFRRALKHHFKTDQVTILGYNSSMAVSVADNYTSNIFRSLVKFDLEKSNTSMSLIVKCTIHDKEQMIEFYKQLQIFKKEKEVYSVILPALYEISGGLCSLSSKYIYYTDSPYEIIMLEDLSQFGFKMCNRLEGLDLDHCLSVVEKIATLHAASIVLYEKEPKLFKNFYKGLFSKNEIVTAWLTKAFESLIEATANWNGFEKYSYKLKMILDKVCERAASSLEQKFGGFNVLNHGDSWVNNFLFSYSDKGQLIDCKFVDYQLVIYTSPVVDLHYFWATSPKFEVRQQHLNTILDRYYSKLIYTLSKLNHSLKVIPSKEQLLDDWKSRAFYGLLSAVVILPLVKASKRKDASFEDFMAEDDDSFRYHTYNNERYRKHLEYLLPFYDKLGALDFY